MNTLFPSFGFNNEAPAMTFYELSAPQAPSAQGFFSRATKAFGNILHSMQYSRLTQTMSQLTDAQLDAIGVRRSDIPSVAQQILKKETSD